ncbi:MAG: hypothetical protein ABIP48_33100 [Planctomycetota bacterium]
MRVESEEKPDGIERSVVMNTNPETTNGERAGMGTRSVHGSVTTQSAVTRCSVARASEGDPDTEKSRSVDQNAAAGSRPKRTLADKQPVPPDGIIGGGDPDTEKSGSVDQKAAARFERVEAQVAAAPGVFAVGGTVVATWRTYRGRRLGPYFRLAYRKGRRQCSIYLGRSEELAGRVRDLLAKLQDLNRWRRTSRRMQREARKSLRRWLEYLGKQLAELGIQRKGFEFRGVRRALATAPPQFIRAWQKRPPTWDRGFL